MSANQSQAYEALIQFLYQVPLGLVQTTLDGRVTMINPMAASLLMPLSPGGDLANLFDVLAAVAPRLHALAAPAAEPGTVLCDDLRVLLPPPTRGAAPATLSINLRRLDEAHLMASISDVTAAVQQEQQRLASQVRDATRVDSLTKLPNRQAALERIDQAMAQAGTLPDGQFAVLLVNVDRFNRVNLTLGPSAGDELLCQMASRLRGAVRQRDAAAPGGAPATMTARLGQDEFVVLMQCIRSNADVLAVAQRVVDVLGKPYALNGQIVHATVSLGVVASAHAPADAVSVLQDAGLAMRSAKRDGGGRLCTFEPALKLLAQQRGNVESELRLALDEGQLFVVYQPIVQLCSGQVSGFEALVRWQHPQRGVVPPIEFIAIAEETGLITRLGAWVLEQACSQFVAWRCEFDAERLRMLSVNLSRAQLLDPTLTAYVRQVLQTSSLPPDCLQLEVTESLAAQDQLIQTRLHDLKSLGLTLALDDFGTGYSSLASLHQLPVDVLKIDRSFVSQVENSMHHRVLIEATVCVARSLGMQTVAEGIETQAQFSLLNSLHCDKAQGYFIARPMTSEAATCWLRSQPCLTT